MIVKNNYDVSSTGLNLELMTFSDVSLAEIDFSECFNVLQRADFRKPSILVFSGWGECNVNDWDPCDYDNWDLSETTVKEMIGVYADQVSIGIPIFSDYRDLLIDLNCIDDVLPLRDCSKETLFNTIKNHCSDDEFLEYLEKVGSPTFAEIKVLGYSQGDVSYVYVPQQVLKDRCLTVDTASSLRGELQNLIYDAPVYARLFVDNDNDEIYLGEYLSDNYYWDRDEVLQKIDLSHYNADQQKIIMDFLESNLPCRAVLILSSLRVVYNVVKASTCRLMVI